MIFHGKNRVPVREAVLHCAAIRTGQFAHMRPFQVFATINQWHHERGFKNGFGYHGLFMPDGTFYAGRPYDMIGAHVLDHNVGTLGFLMIESRQITHIAQFGDWFTSAQQSAVKAKLQELRANLGLEKVSGHNDYAPKLCPGFKVISSEWI